MLQTKNLENRRYNQTVAAFNLGVSEAVKVIKIKVIVIFEINFAVRFGLKAVLLCTS